MVKEPELPAVARSVVMACRKCDTERYFRVIAHTSSTSAKCECEVCHSKKTFKLPKVQERKSSKPSKAKKRVSAKKSASASKDEWHRLRESLGQRGKPYSMQDFFKENEIVEHPKFGLGFITQSTPVKVEVLFENGSKELIHNRA